MKRSSILVLILSVCFVSAAWGQQARWSEFHRHNMQRLNPYENVLNVNNVGNLTLKWSYATGNEVYSSPAVMNGVVYVGSVSGKVYALDASTGTKLWSYTTGGGVWSSPAVANGVVYVGSLDHNVYALRASTGHKLWSYTTGYWVYSPTHCGKWGCLCRLGRQQRVRTECEHWRPNVELPHYPRTICGYLARSGKWGGLCRLMGPQCVCAERQHRGQALELYYRR
jgi:hypothetical protein